MPGPLRPPFREAGPPMTLRFLFTVHAIITFAAGAVLVVWPGAIPSTVGIQIEPNAYLLCYLLAAMEFGAAALSWGARTITDAKALRVIVTSGVPGGLCLCWRPEWCHLGQCRASGRRR